VTRVQNDPYEVLGVARDASADDIKRSYRALAMRYHPDRNPGDTHAEERFKTISEAYATLRDAEARRRYDTFGPAATGATGAGPVPDFSTVDWRVIFQEADIPMDWGRRGGIPTTGSFVFDALFRGVATMFRNAGLMPGEDRTVPLRVHVSTARDGGTQRVRVPGPIRCDDCRGSGHDGTGTCPRCGGAGVLRVGMDVDVRVPRGVRDGTRLRLQGLGGPGQPPGDAYVQVTVELPSGTRVHGGDLLTELFVTPLEAARGLVTTVLGVRVPVSAGASDGQQVRVAGGGLGGDLVVTLRTDTWRGLGRAALDLVRSFTERISR
jgi:molecular chaperone DnaJ